MDLISVASARAVWLVNAIDLNPRGLRILPPLTEALIDKYDFDPPPDQPEPPQSANSIKLKEGMFESRGECFRVGLEIYDDGFVAESRHSTALTEEFLSHVFEWAKENFDIRFVPSLLSKKLYNSEVVVRFSSALATASQPIAQFAELLSDSVPAPGLEGFTVTSFTLSTRIQIRGSNSPEFTIERRANTAPNSNLYYCKSPLATDEFLKLLAQFDLLLSKA